MRAFERMIEARRAAGMQIFRYGQTAEQWFDWWMSDRAAGNEEDAQLEFEFDSEQY